MTRVVLSVAAKHDLEEIDNYTIAHFGLRQAARTREAFGRAFDILANMPLTGHLWPEVSPPGRPFRFHTVLRRFEVVYEPSDDGIRVARVLHGRRDLGTTLETDSGDVD